MNDLNPVITWKAVVYHFTCVSSRGKDWYKVDGSDRAELQKRADTIEMNKFIRKINIQTISHRNSKIKR